ncbi:winged helix-turn-helix transcriptional regulator [Solihabitans fulvus]|uniref:Winged helix-turn-helix transcriptional regulator n=1 Tax=Solihabitans fulvus TaxID=1892852 RepID=A0A5B2WUD5_9PSEU|nr:MarR family winged helix-turn-helix transcriptional regulator [Solihabitans fulvus]KAA2254480.1 winged helix-turn-helix transcriptional regulator [Solihabitans fulvus]
MDGSETDEDPRRTLAAVERSMIQLRRNMARRTLGRQVARESGQAVDLSLAGVVDAIDEGPEREGQEITVGLVADRMGVDPSRASRLVAAAIEAGYARRVASQVDGRRIQLELTPAGHDMVTASHRHRQDLYERLMRGWSEQDRGTFALLLNRFTDAMAEFRREQR